MSYAIKALRQDRLAIWAHKLVGVLTGDAAKGIKAAVALQHTQERSVCILGGGGELSSAKVKESAHG